VRLKVLAGVGEDELAEFHAAQGEDAVGDCLQFSALALHDDDFEAVVMVEVDVGRGEDHGSGAVLNVGELLGEIGDVVVVDQGEGAYDGLIRIDVFFEKGAADEVADGLGTVLVTAFGDKAIELLEEVSVERDAGAA
jgi:hypothetical protein